MVAKHMGENRGVLAGLVMALLVAASGCGGGKGNVSGQVRFDGQPLPDGEVTFFSQTDNKKVVSSHIKDGSYRVENVPAGPVKIAVKTFNRSKIPQTAPPAAGKDGKAEIPEMLKNFPVKPPEESDKSAPPGKYVAIPPRYADPEQSGLEYTVSRGDQQKDLELTR